MNKEIDWQHKDIWSVRYSDNNFSVTVEHFTRTPIFFNEGENSWCVYVYLYPEHPLFKEINPKLGEPLNTWDERFYNIPFHGGCTYAQLHINDNGTITSIQLGADYQHFGDEEYSRMSSKEDAYLVFYDAKKLINWAMNYPNLENVEE